MAGPPTRHRSPRVEGNRLRFEGWRPALERSADAVGGAGLAVVCGNATARRNSALPVSNQRLVAGSGPWIIPQLRRLNRYGERIGMPVGADEADQLDQTGNGQHLSDNFRMISLQTPVD